MSSMTSNAENMAKFTAIFLIGIGILQILLGTSFSKSVALTANGIDCIGDGFVSSVVWVGIKFFKKPADDKFHYGYYKVESLASIIAAIIMVFLATYIGYRSYLQFKDPDEIEAPLIGAIVALIAGIVAIALGIIKYQEGKKSKLQSLKLEVFNTIKDGTASLLTVIALILANYGYLIADAIIGFIIATMILSIGFASIKESSYVLVDACDMSCISQRPIIKNIAENTEGVKTAHVVRLRRTGPLLQGEMMIEVPGEMTMLEVDHIRSNIQKMLKEKIPDIQQFTINAISDKKLINNE